MPHVSMLPSCPQVDDVHPFYGDLMNVLYDKVPLQYNSCCTAALLIWC